VSAPVPEHANDNVEALAGARAGASAGAQDGGTRSAQQGDTPGSGADAGRKNEGKQPPADATREDVTNLLSDRDRMLPGSPVYAYSTIYAQNFIGGDSFDRAGSALFQAGKCRPDLLSKLAAVFEPPGCMSPALGSLQVDYLVCLRGSEGSGRMTLAIQLLRHLVNDDVWEIRPGTPVRELVDAGFERSRGYLLRVGTDDETTEFEFRRLRHMCEAKGCYLALVCPAGSARLTRDYPVIDVARPDAESLTLLRRHTLHSLSPGDLEAADDLLRLPEVSSWCHGSHPLSDLNSVAAILTDVVRGRIDREALARHLDLVSRDGMQAWFNESDPALRPLIITLTFFGGLPTQIVLELEDGLGIRLRQASGESAPRDLFSVSGRARLGDASAHTAVVEHEDSYGTARTEVVEFSDRTWESNLGLLLRTEYPSVRPVLVAWLRDLAEHHDVHVQRRAALALGSFARDSLGSLIHQVIGPWATLQESDDWQKVVSALIVPLCTPETASRATRLLEQWAASDAPELVFCAAMVYGIALASSNPDEALAGLARIARRDGQDGEDWLDEAAAGLIAMYLGGDHDAEVLAAIRRWSISKKKTECRLALSTFVDIASNVESRIDPASSPFRNDDALIAGKRQDWPSLLLDACRSATSNDVIATAREALNNPEFSVAAISALRSWFGRANTRPYLVRPLTNLVIALARTAREADRLAHHLGAWAEKKPSSAAAKVRDALLGRPPPMAEETRK
jgi:hypothetical protein